MDRIYGDLYIDADECEIRYKQDSSFAYNFTWALQLADSEIVCTQKRKQIRFLIADIKEIQFEVNGYGRSGNANIATAYVILKNDPEPRRLFSIVAAQEEFVLASKTKAYDFCKEVLNLVTKKYNIPSVYKLSIETKEKSKGVFPVFLLLVIITIMLWLRFKFRT